MDKNKGQWSEKLFKELKDISFNRNNEISEDTQIYGIYGDRGKGDPMLENPKELGQILEKIKEKNLRY